MTYHRFTPAIFLALALATCAALTPHAPDPVSRAMDYCAGELALTDCAETGDGRAAGTTEDMACTVDAGPVSIVTVCSPIVPATYAGD